MTQTNEQEWYNDWVEETQEDILEAYICSLEFDDMPDHVTSEIATDDVDEWTKAMERWTATLTIDDVPEQFIQDKYDDWCDDQRN